MSQPSGKPVILTFARYYLPGYKAGGPIRSICNLVDVLGDEFDFRIVTSDRDATDTEPYAGLSSKGTWRRVGKASVRYLSPRERGLAKIAQILKTTPHDTLYLNSFFDPVFTAKPLLAQRLGLAARSRCVIAPRGEFSGGALALKTGKKRAYLCAADVLGLYRGLTWQASGEHERSDILQVQHEAGQDVRVAPDLSGVSPDRAVRCYQPRAEGQPLRVCFLARISPMKNLDFALRVLQQVRVPVRFNIYGPVNDGRYWDECRAIIGQMPAWVDVHYHGVVDHHRARSIMASHELFFLPTRGENFGHVILEALSAGTPVLISDTTPWRNLPEAGAGWDLALSDIGGYVTAIEHMAGLTDGQLRQARNSAFRTAVDHARSSDALNASRMLFSGPAAIRT